MKNNLALNNEIIESTCLLDEACNIYPGLLEIRTKCPNIYREFEITYTQLCYSINSEIVNLGRHLGVDSEEALKKTNRKFVDRFKFVEDTILSESRDIQSASLEEMEKLWNEAKILNS